tara:strand:- start:2488 stop:3018 length:531 start_codon:yes stop_codon:yes gene_type:complete
VWKEENDNRQFNFNRCTIHYLETTQRLKRAAQHEILNIYADPYPEWETEEQRHDLLSDWAMNIVRGSKVFIEGYAFATSGKSHVRSVAENSGLLKHKMYRDNQEFISVPPTVIKKFATDKGNANKELMYNAFSEESNVPKDFQKTLRPKSTKLTNPTTDIVDSYWICKYGWKDSIA